jgi:hypothetical protein
VNVRPFRVLALAAKLVDFQENSGRVGLMISEATEDAIREWWRASIPKEFRALSGSPDPASSKRPKSPKLPAHDGFEDFLVAMAEHCGTGPGAALSSRDIWACAGLHPMFELHRKHGAVQLGFWFAFRHGKPYGRYTLRRTRYSQSKPMLWHVDVVAAAYGG